MKDRNVVCVQQKLGMRSKVGVKKYGVTTDKANLTRLQWLQHAQEEAMDLSVYLEELIQEERKKVNGESPGRTSASPAAQ